jgi:hypothetical protein
MAAVGVVLASGDDRIKTAGEIARAAADRGKAVSPPRLTFAKDSVYRCYRRSESSEPFGIGEFKGKIGLS